MKNSLALLLSAALCLSLLAACSGGKEPDNSPSGSPDPSMSVTPAETPTPDPTVEPSAEPSAEPSQDSSDEPAQPTFQLSSNDFTLFSAGSSWRRAYTAEPALTEAVVFTSSDESVATVDEDGTVTAVAPGQATITATAAKAAAVLQARVDTMANGGAWYPEATRIWSECATVVTHGNYVMMVVSEQYAAIAAEFNALF